MSEVVAVHRCTKCGELKTATGFYWKSGRRRYGHCKACHYLLTNTWRQRNQALVNERARVYNFARRVGLPLAEAREVLATVGARTRCDACGKRGRRGIYDLHIDHDHKTGRIRGLLCQDCNFALGQLRDDPARVRQLLAYIVTQRRRAQVRVIPQGTKEKTA